MKLKPRSRVRVGCWVVGGGLAAWGAPQVCGAEAAATPRHSLFTLPFEELGNVPVVTASRKAEPIDVAPNVMYVITADEIKRRGYTSLQHVLENVPGFAVFHRDLQFVAQVRGIAPNDNEKITVMVNGHSINQVFEPEVLGGAIPLENLERIEIIVGPGSVLYGADTLGAIVNLITKTTAGQEAVVHVGTYNTTGVTAMSGREFGERRNLFLSASYRRHAGFDAWLPDASNPRDRFLAGSDLTGELLPSVTVLGRGQCDDWELQYFALNAQMPDLHLHGNRAADDGRRYDYIHSGMARHTHEWTDRFSTTLEFSGDYKRVLRSIVEAGSGSGEFLNLDVSQSSYGTDLAGQYRTDASYFQAGLRCQVKQHRHNYDFQWTPENPAAMNEMLSLVKITDTHSVGGYISEEYALTPWLTLVGAVRCDRDDMLEGNDVYTSPRLAAVIRARENWVMKLMHNKATRMPSPVGSPLNRIWGVGNPFAPDWANANPPVERPETLTATEFQNILYFLNTRLSVNVYYQELEDFITWYSPWTNVGDFEGVGGECDARTRVSDTLTLWVNASLSDNEFRTESRLTSSKVGSQGFQLPANDKGEVVAVPRYMANAGVEWQVRQDVTVCPAVRYFTRQPMFRNEAWTYADDRAYLDTTVTWQNVWRRNVDLRLVGRNLTNNRDPIGTQWLADAYRPRGTAVELALYCRF